MAYRNKTYVAFDGDSDIIYYSLMKAWKQSDKTDFDFYNAHDINMARDSSTEETIKRKLRERLNNSKVFVLLIGEHTKNLYKFVRWEIVTAIEMNLPIICVNLNGSKNNDDRCPPILNDQLAVFIPFKAAILQYALENWPSSHVIYKNQKMSGAYVYNDSVYKQLGI